MEELAYRDVLAAIGLRQYLEENNSYPFFEALEDLLITGPTNTNVMDLRICLIV